MTIVAGGGLARVRVTAAKAALVDCEGSSC